MVESHFADRLAALVTERRSQVVLGLDPDPQKLYPAAVAAAEGGSVGERACGAVLAHCRLVIDAAGPACVAVKLQLACFERLGPYGWQALFDVAEVARDAGLIVIADGKRGDVPVTASAYAQALVGESDTPWGRVPGLGADAFTVNPMMGRDSLVPFVESARQAGAGVFILVRTSNPGASDLQDLSTDGEPLHKRLAGLVAELGAQGGATGDGGLTDVGAVVGATQPEFLGEIREIVPKAVLLLPGVGVQGGQVERLAAAFTDHPASALVAASRGIVAAHEREGGDPAQAAQAAAERLREATWRLVGA